MKFALKNVLPNPFRDLEFNPVDAEKIDKLIESMKAVSFWENIVGRVIEVGGEKKLQLAYGHARLEALRQMFEPEKTFDWIVRSFTDAQMLQAMCRENAGQFENSIQALIESVRATVQAYGDGLLTEEDILPPALEAHSIRYAPSFQETVPESGTVKKHPYTAKSIAGFLGESKKDGEAKERLHLVLDSLDLHETGDFPTEILRKCKTLYSGEKPLATEVYERTERREIRLLEEQKKKEQSQEKKSTSTQNEFKEAEKELKAAREDLKLKKGEKQKAVTEHKKAESKAKKTNDQNDIDDAELLFEEVEAASKALIDAGRREHLASKAVKRLRHGADTEKENLKKERKKLREQEDERKKVEAKNREAKEKRWTEENIRTAELVKLQLKIVSTGYRSMAKTLHPDAGGDNAAMAKLNEANDKLVEMLEDSHFTLTAGA